MNRKELEAFLDEMEAAMRVGRQRRRDIRAELEDHIETALQSLLASGVSREEAIRRILEDLGGAGALARRFAHIGQTRRWMMKSAVAAAAIAGVTLVTSFLMPPQPGNPLSPSKTSAGDPAQPAAGADFALSISQPLTPDDEAILRALEERVDVDFKDTRLEDALRFVRDAAGVNMVVRWYLLELNAIESDSTIALELKQARLSSVLSAVLDLAGAGETTLTYGIRGGLLVVSTIDDLSGATETRLYDCTDLVRVELTSRQEVAIRQAVDSYLKLWSATKAMPPPENVLEILYAAFRSQRMEELVEAICNSVDPHSWRRNGGNVGEVSVVGRTLVVVQTCDNQDAIQALLEGLRELHRRTAGRHARAGDSPATRQAANLPAHDDVEAGGAR